MMPVTIAVEISEFDDDEIIEEAQRRGLWEPADGDDLLELMDTLGVPDELKQPVKAWLSLPVATPEKLQEWVKAAT